MQDDTKPDAHYAAGLSRDGLVPLEAILCTEELTRRPPREPDYQTEHRALARLVQALADSPSTILQTLADTLLNVFKADSAGLSLLTEDGKSFYWPAIAGGWKPHLGGGTPRDFGPCGDVLDRNMPLLFSRWERRYPYLLQATPLAEEGLLVPFYVGGKAVGTIWAIAHTDRRRFDAEDLRQLESLGRFASAAYQSVQLQHAEEGRRSAVNLMEEAIRARHAVESLNNSLRESEERYRILFERYRTLFELGPVAVFSCDAAGKIQMFNRRALELWGREPSPARRFSGAHKLLDPDGGTLAPEQSPVAKVLNGTPEIRAEELILERPDGSRLTVLANVRPLKNDRGEIIGAIEGFYDITERKQAEARQQLLIDELNHRVKNTLATVQSIAAHTLTDAEAQKHFDDRLIALSRTHDVLARASWERASIRELLDQELEPFRSRSPFLLEGPDIDLRPKAALALGLAFHELATNAAKYGALSVPAGRLRVQWQRLTAAPPGGLRLQWAETRGPAVKKPACRGFGLSVIERGLALELGGKVALDFKTSGVVCLMEIPRC